MRIDVEFEVGGIPASATGQVYRSDGHLDVHVDGDWPTQIRYRIEDLLLREYWRLRDAERDAAEGT